MKRLDDWMRPHDQGLYRIGRRQVGVASTLVTAATFFASGLAAGLLVLDRPLAEAASFAAATALGASLVPVAVLARARFRRR